MTKETEEKKPLTLNRPKTLELKKKVDAGQVRQSFSHGRSKTVQVEVKRKRVIKSSDAPTPQSESPAVPSLDEENLQGLSKAEVERRRKLIAEAEERRKQQEEEEAVARAKAEAEAKERAEQEAVEKAAQPEDEAEAQEPAVETTAGAEAKEDSAANAAPEEVVSPADVPVEKAQPSRLANAKRDEAAELERARKKSAAPKSTPGRTKGEPRRRQSKLTITQALDEEELEYRERSLAALKRQREREKEKAREALQQGAKIVREVVVPEAITVQELANRMAERGGEVVKTLMKLGVMATINQTIDADTAELVIEEFGHRIRRVSEEDVELGILGEKDDTKTLKARPPVVTIMGHVDHGKTSLLDALRASDVAAHEAGGITQHIGAYQIEVASGDKITFIDTPGHAAFTEMRSRGANVTDIVILVVAADDGIMDQTKEAIAHAKAAKVPIIVAINKIDKPDSDPNRVKTELLSHDLVPEDMGGDVICVPCSAITREGLDSLVESILLQAEVLELKANPDRDAVGTIIEAKLEQGRGSVATVLVQRGTLKMGDVFVAGAESGRVRALLNERGERIESAGPSEPVEVLGLNGTPEAGDDFVVVEDDARAREIAEYRAEKKKTAQIAAQGRGTLEQMISRIQEGEAANVPVVIKSDVHGSLEAIIGALDKLGTEEVRVSVLHSGVGGINESDVSLARASDAMIIAFNVRANAQARDLARRDAVDIRYYSIIYDVIDDMKAAMSGLLSPDAQENFLGYAEIRDTFNITKVGRVAGCMVTDGSVKRGARVRLLRDNVVIHDGMLKTLRRFKDEVREVQQGYECGMAFENYQDIQVGDQIECYEVNEVARTL